MQCNQRFFGQEHYERGTPERDWAEGLRALKPAMMAYGFAFRDQLPDLPPDTGGIVQVKYNGMLTVVLWDEQRQRFVRQQCRQV